MTPLSADLAATLRRALAAHRSGQWTRAAAGYEQILLAQPDYPEVLQLLGTVRFQTGDAASAVTLLERVIALQPLSAAPHVSLALVFQSVRRFQDALGHLTRALELNPAVPDVLVMRGNVLRELDRHAAALADYEAALRLRPDNPEALNNRGNLLRHFHRHDEALESYARAIALRPGFAEAHVNRGNGLRELNRLDAAREAYQRALEIVPDSVRVHRSLASVTPLTRDGALYRALQSFARRETELSPPDRIALHFALGDAMTAFGEHEQAFAHVLAGNALQRARLTYDEASALAQLATLRRTLTRDYLDARRGAGDPADSPVFIVGMPRSGSTLIEQVLASHPDVYGAGEYPAFSGALRKRVADRYAGYDDATLLGSMTPADYTAIGEGYLHEIRALRGLEHGYRRIVDKTLVNFMHLGLIHLALPHARFIHARRSPVETCLSCFSKLLEDVPCSFDLGELGRYYAAYDELMAHWRAVLPPGVLLEVRYEEMVGDLPAQVRRILAHCGLEWHPGCLDFHHSTRPVATASSLQVREPIHAGSLKRWRPAPDILAPLIAGLGQLGDGGLSG